MYEYETPAGYGDSFYVWAINGEDIPIANGQDYNLIGLPILDDDFVCRVWGGGNLFLASDGTIQLYDGARNAWFLYQPILQSGFMPSGLAVLPEKLYRTNTAIRFDLTDVALAVNTNGTASVYADQMAWYGVKRAKDGPHDPLKSTYKYYEKEFSYPFGFQINNYGLSDGGGNPLPGLATATQYTQLITDFDFELRQILMNTTHPGSGGGLIYYNEEGQVMSLVSVGGASGTINFYDSTGTPNVPLSISVVGNNITVMLQTNAGGNNVNNGTTTINQIINLINTTPASAAIALATFLTPGGNFGLFDTSPGNNTRSFSPGGGSVILSPYASPFKILLYDATWRQRSNIPLLAEYLCRNPNTASPKSNAPNNAWPSPPLLYPVNSVIRFDIFSLIPNGDTLPVTVNLLFKGVRRITC